MARFHQVAVLYLGTFAFGLTMGGIVMMQSLLVGDCFGMVSFGTIIGFSGLFTQLGAAFGPTIAGHIFDATHDYKIAFTIFGITTLSAIVAVFFAGPPKPLWGVSALRRDKIISNLWTRNDGPNRAFLLTFRYLFKIRIAIRPFTVPTNSEIEIFGGTIDKR